MQHKVPCEFGFLEDEDIFFAKAVDRATRNKAKTDYQRRQSNEISQGENFPNERADEIENDAIPEVSIEETLKESASLLME